MSGANRVYVDLNDLLFNQMREICFKNKLTHKAFCERAIESYLKEGVKKDEKIKVK